MKKFTLAFVSLILTLMMLLSACGGDKDDKGTGDWNSVTKTKITIYVDASNTYGTYVKGSAEAYVKEAIEKKFYQDTGIAVDFNVQYHSHSTFSTVFGAIMTTGKWDAAVSYLGQAGLDETALDQDIAMDLSDLLDNYPNILKAIDEQAFYATTLLDNTVIGIPSVAKTKTKGLLIRKDYMLRVGYTDEAGHNDDLGTIYDAPNGRLKTLKTIDDFTDMLRRMKAQIEGCTMPLIGTPYDIEFVITPGATGTAGYQYKSVIYNEDGTVKEVVPGWLSKGYDKVLAYEYLWQKEQLWESDNTTKTMEQRISDFSNGKGGVFCADANILNLISVARQVKSVDPSAQFTIVKPLDGVDENGNAIEGSGAYVETSRTVDCMIINKKSQNAEKILAYLNWVYSSKENYELCAYGIKGEHWVEAGDGYYSYPAGKEERYLTNPPYSGVFAFLHNDELSYRLYSGYTEEERGWINTVETARTIKNDTDGMLFYNMTSLMATNFQTAENELYLYCATKAWAGLADPAVTYPQYYQKYKIQAADYIEWLTQQYNMYIAKRSK